MKSITLTQEQLLDLISGDEVEGFEDFEADADPSTGTYDGEKGAMYDFEITLTNIKTGENYISVGGYYTGPTGYRFYEDIVFDLEEEDENPDSKYYLITLDSNYADEFDVEGFIMLPEDAYKSARASTEKTLERHFKVNPNPRSEEDFNKLSSYKKNFYDYELKKYVNVTYEMYVTNHTKYDKEWIDNTYELYFGTNEQLMFNSAEDYWSCVEVQKISKIEYDTVAKLLGTSYGTCNHFFPLGDDWDEEETEE